MVRVGSSVSIAARVRASNTFSTLAESWCGSALSVRSFARLASSISVYGISYMGSSLSVLDYVNIGSSMSLRSFASWIRFVSNDECTNRKCTQRPGCD